MKAIILAAGYGKRLNIGFPKCLIQVNGKSLLDKLVCDLRDIGIDDISVVVGYQYNKIKNQLVKQYLNEDWSSTDEFYSLLCAKKELNDDVIVLFSDIVIHKEILERVKNINNDIAVMCDDYGFCGVVKFSKKVCNDIKQLKDNKNKCLKKSIGFLSMAMGYKVKRVEIDGTKCYNIDTKSDLEKVRNIFNVVL